MYESTFEIIALGARYWFALLCVFILVTMLRNVRAEMAAERTAATLGTGYALYRLEPLTREGYPSGRQLALRQETTLGSGKHEGIALRGRGLRKEHAVIYKKGRSVRLQGNARGVKLNGKAVGKKGAALSEGDVIEVGAYAFVLRREILGERPDAARETAREMDFAHAEQEADDEDGRCEYDGMEAPREGAADDGGMDGEDRPCGC